MRGAATDPTYDIDLPVPRDLSRTLSQFVQRNVDGLRRMACLPLIRFPDIEQEAVVWNRAHLHDRNILPKHPENPTFCISDITSGNRVEVHHVEQGMRTRTRAAVLVRLTSLAATGFLVAGCGEGATGVQPPPGGSTPATASPSPSASNGADSSPSGDGETASPSDGAAETELVIDISIGEEAGQGTDTPEPRKWTLTCSPAGGSHPAPEAACSDLDQAGGVDALEEVPADQICTEIYGGPEVAKVTGHVGGTEIDTEFTKSGGCEMERYSTMGSVLDP